jgi:pSer/pThr/pTyr-binding forkhead associated (FHA) protein
MGASPLDAHQATPSELRDRIDAERRGTPFLVYRDGDGHQQIVDLHERDHVTIGRREGSDICLEWDREVSRLHAELQRTGGEWTIADDGLSRNGTYLNGRRVTERARLRDGDVLAIGDTPIAFQQPEGGDSQPTMTALRPRLESQITPAQRRVLVALCRPYRDAQFASPASNKEIAEELVVSVDAVKTNLRALFELFGLDDLPQNRKRATLAQDALRSGVVSRRDL